MKSKRMTALAVFALAAGTVAFAPGQAQAQEKAAPPPRPEGIEKIISRSTNEIIFGDEGLSKADQKRLRELAEQARALTEKGKLAEAALKYEEGVRIRNGYLGDAFEPLADLYRRLGRTDDLIALYDAKVNRWQNGDAEILLPHALLLLQAKRSREALRPYHQALWALMPYSKELPVPLEERFDTKVTWVSSRRLETAIETGLGMVAFKEGQYAMALPHFQRATRLDPMFATAQFYLGATLRQSFRQFNLAASDAAFAKAVEGGSPEIQAAVDRMRAER